MGASSRVLAESLSGWTAFLPRQSTSNVDEKSRSEGEAPEQVRSPWRESKKVLSTVYYTSQLAGVCALQFFGSLPGNPSEVASRGVFPAHACSCQEGYTRKKPDSRETNNIYSLRSRHTVYTQSSPNHNRGYLTPPKASQPSSPHTTHQPTASSAQPHHTRPS